MIFNLRVANKWFSKIGLDRQPAIGDIFKVTELENSYFGTKYVLTDSSKNTYKLVNLKTGNRWHFDVEVNGEITEQDWDLITDGKSFTYDS